MKKDDLSKEDLFRLLRIKEVEQLGQVNKAFFETTGQVSVMFQSPKKIKPGLSILPDTELLNDNPLSSDGIALESACFTCVNCGYTQNFTKDVMIKNCDSCKEDKWIKAVL